MSLECEKKMIVNKTEWISWAAVFVFLHVVIWAIASTKYFFVLDQPFDLWGNLFAVLFAVGHLGLLGLLLFLLLLCVRLLAWNWRSIDDMCFIVSGTMFSCVLAIDMLTFTLFRIHLSPSILEIFFSGSPFEIYDPPVSFYVMAGLAFALICLMEYFILFFSKKRFLQKRVVLTGVVYLLVFIGFNLIHAVAVVKSYPPILARVEALPYASPVSARKFVKSLGVKETSPQDWGEKAAMASLDYPKGPIALSLPPRPLNVIVILLDSWRVDSLNDTVMPRLWERAKGGIVFEKHFSGGNATRFGVFSLFYGVPPSSFHTFLGERREPILMEKLREKGYEFGLYSSGSIDGVNILDTSLVKLKDQIVYGKGDLHMEKLFLDYLTHRDSSKPFFGFIFYGALHGQSAFPNLPKPFLPTERWDYLKFSNNIDRQPYLNSYYNAAHTMDYHIAGVLDKLKALGRFEDSIIIITGDHSDEVNDTKTNSWGHSSNFSRYQIQVPFIMFHPDSRGWVASHRTTHEDVARTFMEEVLGASPSDARNYTLGVNMLKKEEREFFICSSYSDNAIIYEDNVYVLKKYGFMKSYDLNGQKTDRSLPAKILQRALPDMEYFYKKKQ